MDRRSGRITKSGSGTNSTESVIKIWFAADYLDWLEQEGREPTADEYNKLSRMIRYSDDSAAQWVFDKRGKAALVRRMISTCGLKDSYAVGTAWGVTQVTASDATRIGLCVATGKVTTQRWTNWILNEMRHVTGEGRFGIIQVRPTDNGKTLAIKNGWTPWNNGTWHVNCLAVGDTWILAVLVRYYPQKLGLDYGAGICRSVAKKVLP